MSEIRTDSLALAETFAAVSNPYTGIGTTRAKSQAATVSTRLHRLSREALEVLPYKDELLRKAICLYPESAAKAGYDIHIANDATGDELPGLMKQYLEKLGEREDQTEAEANAETFGLSEAFCTASILARQFGKAYVLMGIDDGHDFSEPVVKDSVRAIRWLQVYDCWEMHPEYDGVRSRQPTHYRLYSLDSNQYGQKIHRSRLLSFWGNRVYSRRRFLGATDYGINDDGVSIIQAMFDAYSDWIQGVKSGSAMLADYDVFTLGMKGLGRLLLEDKQKGTNKNQEAIANRALALDMGKSTVRGIYYDLENEEPGAVNRTYSGADAIMETLERRWVAVSGVPKFKLFGEIGSQGLTNNQGLAMRSEWAILSQDFAYRWMPNLKRILTYGFLAKDSPSGGKMPEDWDVTIPYDLPMTDSERMEFENKAAERSEKLFKMGAITPEEVRTGYEGAEFSSDYVLTTDFRSEGEKRTDSNEVLSDEEWDELAEISAADFVEVANSL